MPKKKAKKDKHILRKKAIISKLQKELVQYHLDDPERKAYVRKIREKYVMNPEYVVGDRVLVDWSKLKSRFGEVEISHLKKLASREIKRGGEGSLEIFELSDTGAGLAGWSGSAILGLIWIPLEALKRANPVRSHRNKKLYFTVELFVQQGIYEPYYNVYEKGKLIGTITDSNLVRAFKKYGRDIVDIDTGSLTSYSYKIPVDILSEILEPYKKPVKKRKLKPKPPYRVETFFERGRSIVSLYDGNDTEVASWIDDDVDQMVEDGFFDSKDWQGSVIQYAMDTGLIPKENPANFKKLKLTFFDEVVEKGIEYDIHESDLYIPVGPESRKLIYKYENILGQSLNVTSFVDSTGRAWFEIPFGYAPYWKDRN